MSIRDKPGSLHLGVRVGEKRKLKGELEFFGICSWMALIWVIRTEPNNRIFQHRVVSTIDLVDSIIFL